MSLENEKKQSTKSSESENDQSIPPELEDMLLKFTIHAVVERPQDLPSFAADYFTRLRDRKSSTKEVKFGEGSKEFIASVLGKNKQTRRATVMGERYNPEEDDDEDEEIEINPKTDAERQRIKEQSQDIFLFRVLDEVDFSAVVDAMIPTPVKKGALIIRQGDDGDFFYLIDRGNFEVFIKDQSGEEKYIATYEGKGFFGELALLHNQPRAATIIAATDGFLWAMSRHTFNRLIVKRAFEKRQLYMKLLDGVPQLKPLTEYEKMQVADALQGKSYAKDEIILREGDAGDGMYFIVEGRVSVRQTTEDGSEEKEVGLLGEGEYFGELALVESQPRAATVIALEDTKAAFLEVKAFERLLGPCIKIMRRHTETYKKQ